MVIKQNLFLLIIDKNVEIDVQETGLDVTLGSDLVENNGKVIIENLVQRSEADSFSYNEGIRIKNLYYVLGSKPDLRFFWKEKLSRLTCFGLALPPIIILYGISTYK